MTSIYRRNRFERYVQMMDKIKVREDFKKAVISEMIRLLHEQSKQRSIW